MRFKASISTRSASMEPHLIHQPVPITPANKGQVLRGRACAVTLVRTHPDRVIRDRATSRTRAASGPPIGPTIPISTQHAANWCPPYQSTQHAANFKMEYRVTFPLGMKLRARRHRARERACGQPRQRHPLCGSAERCKRCRNHPSALRASKSRLGLAQGGICTAAGWRPRSQRHRQYPCGNGRVQLH